MLEEIDECVDAGHSFAFETTLSGLGYLKKMRLGNDSATKLSYGFYLYLAMTSLCPGWRTVSPKVDTTFQRMSFADVSKRAWLIFTTDTAGLWIHGLCTTTTALSQN